MNLVNRLPVPNYGSFSLVGNPKALQPIQGDQGWAINIVRCIVYAMFWFFSNIVKNIEVDVFFKTSLKHRIVKQKVRCFTRCFRFQMAWAHNAKNDQDIQYYCLCDIILLTMPVFLSTNFKKPTLLSHIVAKFQGFTAIINLFKIVTKNIANMHREHDVSAFFKHR